MKYVKKFCVVIFFLALVGTALGKITGDIILSSALRGNLTFFTFIFSPSRSFIDTYSLLNNSNDYKRLAGYYAYKETGIIDLNFLFERYKNEDSDIIKKTIIWIAEDNNDKEKLVDFYRKLYNISSDDIKKILIVKIEK